MRLKGTSKGFNFFSNLRKTSADSPFFPKIEIFAVYAPEVMSKIEALAGTN